MRMTIDQNGMINTQIDSGGITQARLQPDKVSVKMSVDNNSEFNASVSTDENFDMGLGEVVEKQALEGDYNSLENPLNLYNISVTF